MRLDMDQKSGVKGEVCQSRYKHVLIYPMEISAFKLGMLQPCDHEWFLPDLPNAT